MTLVGGAALYMMGGQIDGRSCTEMMRRSLTLTRDQALDRDVSAAGACRVRRLTDCVRCAPVLGVDHARCDHRAAGARRLELQHGSRWRRSSAA